MPGSLGRTSKQGSILLTQLGVPLPVRTVDTRSMDAESRLIEVVERFQRAIADVRNDVRGLPFDIATARLLDAMRHHDVYMPHDVVRRTARHLSDPWWPIRHPFTAWREARPSMADTEGENFKAEADELSRRVDMFADRRELNSLSVQSRRTLDAVTHVVCIDPWSSSMARRIVEVAAPITVDVRPATSH